MPQDQQTQAPPRRRRRLWPAVVSVLGVLVVAVALLVVFWQWDWLIPILDRRASAALGRPVSVAHLHVRLGRVTTVVGDDVRVDNPQGFPQPDPLATARHLTVRVDVWDYIRHRTLAFPLIALDHADVVATTLADGRSNYAFGSDDKGSGSSSGGSALPRIDDLRIVDSHVHFTDPKLKADFAADVATRAAPAGRATRTAAPAGGEPAGTTPGARDATGTAPSGTADAAADPAPGGADAQIVVAGHGTYSGQPITARFVGGALLSVMSRAHPYPVDLRVENGATRVTLLGTIQDPVHFAGADLRLELTGRSMSDLFPLTGIPIPPTPEYSISGRLNYVLAARTVQFHDFKGRVGTSDLEGSIDEKPGAERPDVTMTLVSHQVNLRDLGGFIGGTPQDTASAPARPKQAEPKPVARKSLLPDQPINLPKIRAADVHLSYRGEHIENTFVPLDNIVARLDLEGGRITLHPLEFGVGTGRIESTIALDANRDPPGVLASMEFQHLSLARIMKATHSFVGDGTLDGELKLDTTGNSMAAMMARGNGGVKLFLNGGGQLSALLLDIAGLEFGNALLSALGVPQKAQVQCFIADLGLQQGIAHTNTLLLQTSEARTTGKGDVNFRDETLDYSLDTRSTHFSIGSLPGPINITGPLTGPTILPGREVAARAGAAVGLGILAGPAALLPTIQFGTGEGHACADAQAVADRPIVTTPPRATRRR